MPSHLVFGTIKHPPVDIDTARKLRTILVHQDSPPYYFLLERGFKNLHKLPAGVGGIPKMLELGRGDAWFTARVIVKYAVRGTTLEGRLKISPPMHEEWMYVAASKNFSEKIAIAYQSAFKALKEDGTYNLVIHKYMGKDFTTP